MPSSPESGPSRILTLTCSTSRRASATALSGVASEQPNEIWIGWPATDAPRTVLCGLLPAGFPPAHLTSAYFAPENDSFSNSAKGPPHVVRMPILIGVALDAPAVPFADGRAHAATATASAAR